MKRVSFSDTVEEYHVPRYDDCRMPDTEWLRFKDLISKMDRLLKPVMDSKVVSTKDEAKRASSKGAACTANGDR